MPCLSSRLVFNAVISISFIPSGFGSTSIPISQSSDPAVDVGHSTPSTGNSWCVASHRSTKPVESSNAAINTLVCLLPGSLSGENFSLT